MKSFAFITENSYDCAKCVNITKCVDKNYFTRIDLYGGLSWPKYFSSRTIMLNGLEMRPILVEKNVSLEHHHHTKCKANTITLTDSLIPGIDTRNPLG